MVRLDETALIVLAELGVQSKIDTEGKLEINDPCSNVLPSCSLIVTT
jgi:hypothetical protein